MSKLMIVLVVLLSLAVAGLFLVKHKNASLRASLDRANNVASEQQATITMLKNQLHVALTRADKNELAQVALRQELENTAKREAQREKTITRLLNENEDFRRWYGADLPDAVRRLDGKTAELVNIMQDNLGGDFKEFQSAYEAVGTDLFDQQEGALHKLTQTATKYVLKLDGWIKKNKSLASTIGIIAGGALALTGIIGAIGLVAWPVITGINAIIAAAGAMGAVFTTVGSAVMTAIGAISWPVVAVVAAIVAGALLIRKYWEPVSAFFGGVVEGLKVAFAPVGELFTPLKPVFDWLGEKLQAAWQWFKNLIAPVKATQDTLNRCRDTGVMFGQALADALMLPLNTFNKLRSGIDWVLEKLGVINKESDTLDQTAARTHAATYGTGGYIPATSSYAGYQAYQPVTAPAGRSYVDQSKNEYHISLTGGTAPGTQLDRQLQDALEKYERDKRARARASMMHDG